MNALSTNQEVISYGIDYLRIVVIGSFGLIFCVFFERLLQATGRTTSVMIAQAVGAIVNIIFDPLLINGFWFLPSLGIKGAAIATITGQYVSMIIGIILNVCFNKDLKFNKEKHPLFKYINEGDYVYFVHSYYGAKCDHVIAQTEYSSMLTAAVAKGNIMGCQFHPEKSGDVGLNILKAFCEWEG